MSSSHVPFEQLEDTSPDEESSELFTQFQKLKPVYATKTEALQALSRKLEQLAAQQGVSVEALLTDAHTTPRSQDHHREARKLESQIAFLRR